VADRLESVVAEDLHESDEVSGHRTLAGLSVIGAVGRGTGLPVAAQVGAHDGEAGFDQLWGYRPPCRVRSWVAVHQQHRGAFPAIADPEAYLTNIDEVESKAFKHLAILTRSSDHHVADIVKFAFAPLADYRRTYFAFWSVGSAL
jgi:hypothetical protein